MSYEQSLTGWVRSQYFSDKVPDGAVVTKLNPEFEKGFYTGCDTCGYGGDEGSWTLWIYYRKENGCTGSTFVTDFKYDFGQMIFEICSG